MSEYIYNAIDSTKQRVCILGIYPTATQYVHHIISISRLEFTIGLLLRIQRGITIHIVTNTA